MNDNDADPPEAPAVPNAENISFRVSAMAMADESELDVEAGHVMVVVGANNSGKSTFLREIEIALRQPRPDTKWIREVTIEKTGDYEDFPLWVKARAREVAGAAALTYSFLDASVQLDTAISWWQSGPPFHPLASWIVLNLDGSRRLEKLTTTNFDRRAGVIANARQAVSISRASVQAISDAVLAAFGEPLVVNKYSGSEIHFQIGHPPEFDGDAHGPSAEWEAAMASLPSVDEQGDGLRAFVNILVEIAGSRAQIITVDEPEAFLHPPQARQIGAAMVRLAGLHGGQVFVATHSHDVLHGMIDSGDPLTIVRLDRSAGDGTYRVVDSASVGEIFSDPLLRYSHAYQGLFSEATVLCESDADCRLYNAVWDLGGEDGGARNSGATFVPCGTKDRIYVVAKALALAGCRVRVILDIDALNTSSSPALRRTIEALGGDWERVRADLAIVGAAAVSRANKRLVSDVKREIDDVLNNSVTPTLQSHDARSIKAAAKSESGWKVLKQAGKSLLAGGELQAYNRVDTYLRSLGIFVVPVGELERFFPLHSALHGPAFVSKVIDEGLIDDETESAAIRDFIRAVQEQ